MDNNKIKTLVMAYLAGQIGVAELKSQLTEETGFGGDYPLILRIKDGGNMEKDWALSYSDDFNMEPGFFTLKVKNLGVEAWQIVEVFDCAIPDGAKTYTTDHGVSAPSDNGRCSIPVPNWGDYIAPKYAVTRPRQSNRHFPDGRYITIARVGNKLRVARTVPCWAQINDCVQATNVIFFIGKYDDSDWLIPV